MFATSYRPPPWPPRAAPPLPPRSSRARARAAARASARARPPPPSPAAQPPWSTSPAAGRWCRQARRGAGLGPGGARARRRRAELAVGVTLRPRAATSSAAAALRSSALGAAAAGAAGAAGAGGGGCCDCCCFGFRACGGRSLGASAFHGLNLPPLSACSIDFMSIRILRGTAVSHFFWKGSDATRFFAEYAVSSSPPEKSFSRLREARERLRFGIVDCVASATWTAARRDCFARRQAAISTISLCLELARRLKLSRNAGSDVSASRLDHDGATADASLRRHRPRGSHSAATASLRQR